MAYVANKKTLGKQNVSKCKYMVGLQHYRKLQEIIFFKV